MRDRPKGEETRPWNDLYLYIETRTGCSCGSLAAGGVRYARVLLHRRARLRSRGRVGRVSPQLHSLVRVSVNVFTLQAGVLSPEGYSSDR